MLTANEDDFDTRRRCGVPHPRTQEECVLDLDHPGTWHMDGNDNEWYGEPDN